MAAGVEGQAQGERADVGVEEERAAAQVGGPIYMCGGVHSLVRTAVVGESAFQVDHTIGGWGGVKVYEGCRERGRMRQYGPPSYVSKTAQGRRQPNTIQC